MDETQRLLSQLNQERQALRQQMGLHLLECPSCQKIGAERCQSVARWIKYHRLLEEQILATAAPYRYEPGELLLETDANTGRLSVKGDRGGLAALYHSLCDLLVNPDSSSAGQYRNGEPWLRVSWLEDPDASA